MTLNMTYLWCGAAVEEGAAPHSGQLSPPPSQIQPTRHAVPLIQAPWSNHRVHAGPLSLAPWSNRRVTRHAGPLSLAHWSLPTKMTRHGGCPAQVTYRQRRPKRKRFTLCTPLLLVGSSTPPALTLMQAAATAGGEE
jgi:hypothetical protein